MALIEAAHLVKAYPRAGGRGAATVVDDVSFTLRRGETLGLGGESGSGKSTIARMVLGLVAPSGGTVTFADQPVTTASSGAMRAIRRRMQPVFQDPYAALNPRMRVRDILAEPFQIHKHEAARSKGALEAAARALLGPGGRGR